MEYRKSIFYSIIKENKYIITIKADNRDLTKNAKFSYLADNYVSGESDIVVVNSDGFEDDDYVLLGEFGTETTEICQIASIVTATHTITLDVATKFAHSQDTKITIIKYNQVRFYHTVIATFSATDPITGYIDLQADNFFSLGYDTTNTTGFGWFVFYNETTAKATSASNPIPYADFSAYSVKKILDSFFSLLNNKELKLINNNDAFRWLNEGYSIAQNELNLINQSFTVPSEVTITTASGVKEYALENNFNELISVTNENGNRLVFIDLEDVPRNNDHEGYSITSVRYFLRGSYIGFSPVPNAINSFNVYYKANPSILTSYYDNVTLPNNSFYMLLDHMMYRAATKTNKPNPKQYEDSFRTSIETMKVTSHKQNENEDSWDISPTANI